MFDKREPKSAFQDESQASAKEDYGGNVRRFPGDHPAFTARGENIMLWRMIGVLLIVVIIEGAVIVAQYPLVRYQPVVLQVADDIYYRVTPITDTAEGVVLARESFARRYVLERETVNLVDDQERWSWVKRYSRAWVWNPFLEKMGEIWPTLNTRNVSWDIQVGASWQANERGDKWAVEFVKTVYEVGDVKERETWIAHIHLGQKQDIVDEPELMDNPFQFEAIGYSVARKADVTEGRYDNG